MDSPEYKRLKDLVERELLSYMPEAGIYAETLTQSMEYSLTAGGKRLRPVLLLAAHKICGGREQDALAFACAMEYIHTYSLIHDDLPAIDNDDYRRGKLTNHKVFGEDMAIWAGDGLLNTAFEIMLQEAAHETTDQDRMMRKVLAAQEIIQGAGVSGMLSGQTADALAHHRVDSMKISRDNIADMLDFIHRRKTGKLIRAALRSGAILAGASEVQLKALTAYGEAIGLVFQIIDDILDIEGDPALLGKATGADAALYKLTFPSIYGIEGSRTMAREINAKGIDQLDVFGDDGEFLKKIAIDLICRMS